MTLDEIKESIKLWNRDRSNNSQLEDFFRNGSGFVFDLKFSSSLNLESKQELFVHAYPGVLNGELYFFMILSVYDNAKYIADFKKNPNLITVSKVIKPNSINAPDDRISKKEALARINNWNTYYKSWIQQQIDTNGGIYQVFVIPFVDIIPNNSHTARFALSSKEPGYVADLIIENNTTEVTVYEDVVRPVPPFGGGGIAKSNFYLLDISIN